MTRYVTAEFAFPEERGAFELYRLCDCAACDGRGKTHERGAFSDTGFPTMLRCDVCRGEGRTHELVATATDEQSLGLALVTLGREGEWTDRPIGILEVNGEPGHKWLVRPWKASAREVSAAGRTLRAARKENTT